MGFCIPIQIRLRGTATLGAPKNQYVYQEVKDLKNAKKNKQANSS